MKNKFTFFLSICSCLFFINIQAQTTVQKNGNTWQLLVDGKPFPIKGATFGYDNDPENYDSYFKELNFLGVNTIRTWGTGKNTKRLLDAAQKHNIKVMVGIWMRHGRPGMEADDSFNYLEDTKGKETMYDDALKTVKMYKDHPAVLTWGIGNEVYLNMATDPEKEAYSKLLERICKDIKTIDNNHPITSVEAWTFGLDWWQKYVPSIDIYGLNSYGAGAGFLATELEKKGIDKPYMVTEFGVTGEWDIKEKSNGIIVEPSDQQKYDAIASGYTNWIQNKANCLGVYVFTYCDGDEHMAPWLFTHYKGAKRPQYWAIREAYTGKKPDNAVPEIETFTLPKETIKSGTWIPVNITVTDAEQEDLEISFHYNQRTGSRKRRDQINTLNYRGNLQDGFEIQLPKEHGAIKVYVTAKDTSNNIGIANTTIVVSDKSAKKKKYLVAKATLPFYVYKDGKKMPYAPSAYMGNYKGIQIDTESAEEVYEGSAALKISYTDYVNWYGFGLVDPPNDWGGNLGGFDITGAKKFSFWAKANKKQLKATIGFGLIDKDKPFPDTAKKSIEVILTDEWKKYTINVKRLNLSCIRSGLVLFSSASYEPHTIYLDNIVFE